jgi:alginate O-acetyltransferase complex protein AlgI
LSFASFEFLVFLAVAWPVFRVARRRPLPRLLWLLFISAVFYGAWKPWYLLLIGASTVTQYLVGRAIGSTPDPGARKAWALLGIAADLALLGTFKYGNWLAEGAEALLAAAGAPAALPRVPAELPVGISFYTFQTLSYTIDVWRGRIPVERSLLRFAVYVFFFPQLVAGPIVRAADFLPQVQPGGWPALDRRSIGQGAFLIFAGLAKKMVLADTLHAFVVGPWFRQPAGHGALEALYALWAANFQVYCDFSGYSDVACGAALLFGHTLPQNFDRPFQSQSPMEHWRRWHISLSTWLKDYLYLPLGGSRGSSLATDRNLVITFTLGGIWHGAGLSYLMWGVYNGLLLVLWRRFGPGEARGPVGRALRRLATFHAICFGLVFLHADGPAAAFDALACLGRPLQAPSASLAGPGLLAFAAAVLLHATPRGWKTALMDAFADAPAWALALALLLGGGVLSLFSGLSAPFFYFQF